MWQPLSLFLPLCALVSLCSCLELTLLHTNDLHSRFDQITSRGSACRQKDQDEGKCYGGVSRIKYKVDQIKSENPNQVIFVNGGDFFQGTVWYSMFKWRIVANLTRPLGYTATSLGNHEFDDGVQDLVSFIDATKSAFPSLACNLDLSSEPALRDRVMPSVVRRLKGGVRVGVVGYVTPETKDLASTGGVVFLDEVESVRKEVEVLRRRGVEVIVAVGHSGYQVDKKIAEEVDGLDIIVGGHTNTFLWSQGDGNVQHRLREIPSGPYPTVVEQPGTGRKVLVVQTSGYGKYLGHLRVKFDRDGEMVHFSGNPILLDQSVGQDPAVEAMVAEYRAKVAEKMEVVVGRSDVFIDGGRPKCRLEECSFGNLITDAMAEEMEVGIALINSGSIKGSFQEGPITMEAVITAQPWANTIDVVTLPGRALKEVLEHSVSQYDASHPDPGGRFLQLSGLIVTYNAAAPVGKRLRKALVGRPDEPSDWEEIDDEDEYRVALSSFMVKGGDGYQMIPDNLLEHKNTGFLDNDLFVSYLRKNDPVTLPSAGRITIVSEEVTDAAQSNSGALLWPVVATAVVTTIFKL